MKTEFQQLNNSATKAERVMPASATKTGGARINVVQENLLDDVKMALAAEKLDCKPIRGVDLPLLSAPSGMLVEVEELETFVSVPLQAAPMRLNDEDKIFAMLLPT